MRDADGAEVDADLDARGQMMIGLALQREHEHSTALAALSRATEAYGRVYGIHHADTLLCGLNRVVSLRALGRPGEALRLIDESLPELRRALGADAPVVRRMELLRADLAAARPVVSQASGSDFFI